MEKEKNFVTKKNLLEILSLMRQQIERDNKFEEAMGEYAPESKGCVFGMNDFYYSIINKMWCNFIEGCDEKDCDGYSWLDWYYFECDFGKKEGVAYIEDKEYKINGDKDFVDFILEFINIKK